MIVAAWFCLPVYKKKWVSCSCNSTELHVDHTWMFVHIRYLLPWSSLSRNFSGGLGLAFKSHGTLWDIQTRTSQTIIKLLLISRLISPVDIVTVSIIVIMITIIIALTKKVRHCSLLFIRLLSSWKKTAFRLKINLLRNLFRHSLLRHSELSLSSDQKVQQRHLW